MGSERKSPMRSARSRERSSLNDYSYANNSVDMGEDNNSDNNNNTNNILENLNLNSSRENSNNIQSTPPANGFKSFMQVLQEKTTALTGVYAGNENKPPTETGMSN